MGAIPFGFPLPLTQFEAESMQTLAAGHPLRGGVLLPLPEDISHATQAKADQEATRGLTSEPPQGAARATPALMRFPLRRLPPAE